MEPEYDFSRAERGKFYREDVIFNTILNRLDDRSNKQTII
jgi:hypothetical protein